MDGVAVALEHGIFDHAFQFANIPRPLIPGQVLPDIGADVLHEQFSHHLPALADKSPNQKGQVLWSFPERGQMNASHPNAVQQVSPERLPGHQFL